MLQSTQPPKPNRHVAARIEELLREQLSERGVAVSELSPADIATGMQCALSPDGSMTYYWQGAPILYVTPEPREIDGESSVLWRMFTKDDLEDSHNENQ
ncbi:MAG: hypothetical protein J6I40_02970 [Mailhella sp.]|nr:hypothetical protein [Mailhella sp.]